MSNWDSLFDTESTQLSKRIEYTSLIVNEDEILGDSTDWEKTDIEHSSPDNRRRDAKHRSNKGSAKSCVENLQPENFGKNGEVLLLYHSKDGLRFTFVPQDTRLDDIAAWLNKGLPCSIPIGTNFHQNILECKNTSKQSLLDIFGGDLNPEKEGITIFIGPIEGKICFKMSKCEINKARRATRGLKASTIDTLPS